MADDLTMMLCNATGGDVTWEITPAGTGQTTIKLDQAQSQYGMISVPFAKSYAIVCGSAKASTDDGSAAAVFNGSSIAILLAA